SGFGLLFSCMYASPPSCPTNTMKDPNVLSVVSWI
ncbi:unnamed protein product, partial [Allacma fusca]